jgi:excisionase family DNA binding protein
MAEGERQQHGVGVIGALNRLRDHDFSPPDALAGEGAADWDRLPLMLTIPETAAVARVGQTTVREAIRSGWLRSVAVKVGAQWRIPRDKLRALLGDEQS